MLYATNKLHLSRVETSVASFAVNYNLLLIDYAVSPYPKNLWFSGALSGVRLRVQFVRSALGITDSNIMRFKKANLSQ